MPVNDGVVSKILTGSGAVTTAGKTGLLFAYVLKGGTEAGSVLFNNGTGSGTALWQDFIKAQTAAGDDSARMTFNPPLVFSIDIYATIGGAGAELSVAYKEIET